MTELVDIENLTDYLITEMATGNTSIRPQCDGMETKGGRKMEVGGDGR